MSCLLASDQKQISAEGDVYQYSKTPSSSNVQLEGFKRFVLNHLQLRRVSLSAFSSHWKYFLSVLCTNHIFLHLFFAVIFPWKGKQVCLKIILGRANKNLENLKWVFRDLMNIFFIHRLEGLSQLLSTSSYTFQYSWYFRLSNKARNIFSTFF